MIEYVVRKAVTQDIEPIISLCDESNNYLEASGNFRQPYWAKGVYPTLAPVSDAVHKGSMFVSVKGDEILGVCRLDHEQHPKYAEQPWSIDAEPHQVIAVHDLVTSPKHYRQGVASSLLRFSVEYARNCNAVTVRSDAHLINTNSRNVHLKNGFHKITQYTGSVYDDVNVIMSFSVFEYLL